MANDKKITIRIVGESGEGIVSTGEILSRILQDMGQRLMTFRTYPAEIKGGQCLFQLRFSQRSLHTPGENPEILICFDEKSYFEHGMAKESGILIYNSDDTAPESTNSLLSIGIPFDSIAMNDIGNIQTKNMIALGALSHLLSLELDQVENLVAKRFAKKGEGVVQANSRALHTGWSYVQDNYFYEHSGVPEEQADEQTVLLSGNQALVLGALAAGCRFYAGYPITPASSIMETMIRELPRFGGLGIQTEDEMAAIGAVIGASYAGKKAMTATSGPGFSLMQEMIGLASMTEIPVVIVDAQRAGPSTGMPTKMEQGDLLMALHGSHGEGPRVVMAPGTVEECFSLTVAAFNIAEKTRTPVILLTDLALAQRMASLPLTLFENVQAIDREILGEQIDGDSMPYSITETGVNPMALPGQPDGMYVPTGLEHDEHGHPNYSPDMHQKMTEKRHKKLGLAFEVHKGFEIFKSDEDESFEIGVISWGSTEGPLREALESLRRENINIPLMQLKLLNPLPRQALFRFIESVEKIVIPEHNYLGQLAGMIEALTAKPVIRLNKVTGLPFNPSELVDFIQKHIRLVPAYHEAV